MCVHDSVHTSRVSPKLEFTSHSLLFQTHSHFTGGLHLSSSLPSLIGDHGNVQEEDTWSPRRLPASEIKRRLEEEESKEPSSAKVMLQTTFHRARSTLPVRTVKERFSH